MLSPELRDEFDRNGLVRLSGAVSDADVAGMRERLWEFLRTRYGITADPASWPAEVPHGFQRLTRSGAFSAMAGAEVVAACAELLGHTSRERTTDWGRPLITFPTTGKWTTPTAGWHIDGGSGPEPGITLFCYLDQVPHCNGGTVVLAGSHRLIGRMLKAADGSGQPLSSRVLKAKLAAKDPWLRGLWTGAGTPASVGDSVLVDGVALTLTELTGAAGDVIIMSTHTLHATAPNTREKPRLMLVQTFL